MKLLNLFISLPLLGQSLFINSGGPQSGVYQPDNFYVSGLTQATTVWGSGIWKDLRYGTSFKYNMELPNGGYIITFQLFEPNNNSAGKRIFTIRVNDYTSDPIDIFQRCGYRSGCPLAIYTSITNRQLEIEFKATLGSAVVSAIEIGPAYLHYNSCTLVDGTCTISGVFNLNLPPQPNSTNSFLLMVMTDNVNIHPTTNLNYGGVVGPLMSFVTKQPLAVQPYRIYQVTYLDGVFQAINVP